jgi:hypothetical protein
MVSTEKCYKSDNFPTLHQAILRDEYLYQVRLYAERAAFLSVESGALRMRVLLGLIEAKATVIDAVIKADGQLHYLSVICASGAKPTLFSAILKRIAPRAIIEEIRRNLAEERVATRAVRDETWAGIPHSREILGLNESKRFLYTLLLEYRALLLECTEATSSSTRESGGIRDKTEYVARILLFETAGCLCGIPDFQVERILPGSNGSHIIQLAQSYGKRVIVVDELVSYRDIDVVSCRFTEKTSRGYYRVDARTDDRDFSFNMVIPALI